MWTIIGYIAVFYLGMFVGIMFCGIGRMMKESDADMIRSMQIEFCSDEHDCSQNDRNGQVAQQVSASLS